MKALGIQLGHFVLVFCCDEAFGFRAMEHIFLGLWQFGSWGCFDEFNRLEERILSAVSRQVQSIQQGLELVGKSLKINKNIGNLILVFCVLNPLNSVPSGIFITTNPNYAGRSTLALNLTKPFRP